MFLNCRCLSLKMGAFLGATLIAGLAHASPGALDTTFGDGGSVVLSVVGDVGGTVTVQADNKIVIASSDGDGGLVFARYNSDGTLDVTFDGDSGTGNGVVNVDGAATGARFGSANLIIQPDGKILYGGGGLARLLSDGRLDRSFGVDGVVNASSGSVRSIYLQPDGKILLRNRINNLLYVIERRNADGSLDTSFGDEGVASVNSDMIISDTMALLPNGQIILGGGDRRIGGFTLARFNSDGSLDSSFGAAGSVSETFSRRSFLRKIAVQPDGKIVAIGGITLSDRDRDYVVMRFNENGTLDTSFSSDGKITFNIGSAGFNDGHARHIALQPDGKIVIGGNAMGVNAQSFLQQTMGVARLNANGTLDTSFSGDGVVASNFGLSSAQGVKGLVIQPDGKIVLINPTFGIVRLIANDTPWDLSPHSFSFTDERDVQRSLLQTTGNITVSGLGAGLSVPVMVSGGEYAVNAEPYTTHSGSVINGDKISVRHTSASEPNASVETELMVGGMYAVNSSVLILGAPRVGRYMTTTESLYSFSPQIDVPRSTEVTSDSIAVSELDASAMISVTNGEYSINNGLFTTIAGTVVNDDEVRVRHTSSASFGSNMQSNLTIGNTTVIFASTTLFADTSPDTFTFDRAWGVALRTTVTSNEITVSGINAPAVIIVSNGLYSINGGTFTTTRGNVVNGDKVRVRHTSTFSFVANKKTDLTIGGMVKSFISTTGAEDTKPDAFNFGVRTEVPRSMEEISDSIRITGITVSAAISVTNGQYSANGGVFTNIPGTVVYGDTVQVRHTSSSSAATDVVTRLTIGGVVGTFTTTTQVVVDTMPDAFNFGSRVDMARSSVVSPFSILTVRGIDAPAEIAVIDGEYSINGGVFTRITGSVKEFDQVRVRHTSSASFATDVVTRLTIGGVTGTFTSTTAAMDATPAAFSFSAQTDVVRSTVVISNSITVTGINAPAAISVTEGQYSINGSSFTNVAGTVISGDTVRVRHTSSTSTSTDVVTQLTIGGVAGAFTSTTIAMDTTPTAFSFSSQTDVARSTVVISSSSITVTGINVPATISVTEGQYSINGGAFTDAAGTVVSGDAVRVRHTSSASAGADVVTQLTINGVTGTFTSTTATIDTMPDAFSFSAQTDVARSTEVTSSSITISGINAPAAISVTQGQYSINGGTFIDVAGTVVSGDTVRVRHTSSASASTDVVTQLTINGVTGTFTSTTVAIDTMPDAFSFSTQTNVVRSTEVTSSSITISGINAPAAISVTQGQYSINGGTFTNVTGAVNRGDVVRVRHTSSASPTTNMVTQLTIGGVDSMFTSTTLAAGSAPPLPDRMPDAFSFSAQTDVALSTAVISDSITVTGINASVAISVSKGQYSINDGAFTNISGTVISGDTVRVNHTSSASLATDVITQLTISGVIGTFTSTTTSIDTTPDAFRFSTQVNVARSTEITSRSIPISGINAPAATSVTMGQYSINGGVFTNVDGTVSPGDTVRVRHISSALLAIDVVTRLTIGGVSNTFISSTISTAAENGGDGGGGGVLSWQWLLILLSGVWIKRRK